MISCRSAHAAHTLAATSTADPLVTTAHAANIKRAVFDSEGGLIYSGGDDKTLKYVAACGGLKDRAACISSRFLFILPQSMGRAVVEGS